MARLLIYNAAVWRWFDGATIQSKINVIDAHSNPLGYYESKAWVLVDSAGYICCTGNDASTLKEFAENDEPNVFNQIVRTAGALPLEWKAAYAAYKDSLPTNFLDAVLAESSLFPVSQCIDANGQVLLPGIHDSHIHVGLLGQTTTFVDLKGCASVEELVERIENHIRLRSRPLGPHDWIIGVSWEQDQLGRYPQREDLDRIGAPVPVTVFGVSLYSLNLMVCRYFYGEPVGTLGLRIVLP